MENFKHYRSEIAQKLVDEKDTKKRHELLEHEKQIPEYKRAQKKHDREKEMLRSDKRKEKVENLVKNFRGYDFGTTIFAKTAKRFAEVVLDPGTSASYENDKDMAELFQKRLKGSTLVDLGCGGLRNVESGYMFATAFGVRKYIGVETNPEGEWGIGPKEPKEFVDHIKTITEGDTTITELVEKNGIQAPVAEFVLTDILEFLSKRTEQSNFMMNGLGSEIIGGNADWFFRLQVELARLVPVGGLVVADRSMYFYLLERLGFEQREDLTDDKRDFQIWERTYHVLGIKDFVQEQNNFHFFFLQGNMFSRILREKEIFKKFKHDNPGFAKELDEKIGSADRSKSVAEGLEPFINELYNAYLYMKKLGASDDELFA